MTTSKWLKRGSVALFVAFGTVALAAGPAAADSDKIERVPTGASQSFATPFGADDYDSPQGSSF